MKLWSFTANALQQSRCCEIGSPARKNQPALNLNIKQRKRDILCLFIRHKKRTDYEIRMGHAG